MTKDALLQEIQELKKVIKSLNETIKQQNETIKLLQQQNFGKKAEKMVIDENQTSLFDGDELEKLSKDVEYDEVVKETPKIVVRHHSKKAEIGNRKKYLDNLEQVDQIHELSQQDLICPDCHHEMKKIGSRVASREVELEPAKAYCVNHIIETAKCHHCHPNGGDKLVSADSPQPLFPHSYYSSSVLAEIISNKYELAVPLHRQQRSWQRLGLPLTTKSMARTVINGCFQFLGPIYDRLKVNLNRETVVHMDETPFRVLEDHGSNSYFWALRTTKEFNQHDIALFHYSDTRSGKVIGEVIGGDYEGTIICDGYGGYSNRLYPKLSFGTCLVHIRREFAELAKIASEFGTTKAKQVLKLMGDVFHAEKNLQYDSTTEKLELRNQLVKPKLDKAYDFITKIENPMGKLKRAINNALRLKDRLYKIFDNAQLPLDNNPVEQSIRPTTLVRKNSLFATSKDGAKANAIIYTIVQTAKLNNLRIFDYLKYVFDQYTKRTAVKVEDLLPWNQEVQAKFHV